MYLFWPYTKNIANFIFNRETLEVLSLRLRRQNVAIQHCTGVSNECNKTKIGINFEKGEKNGYFYIFSCREKQES